MSDTEYDDFNIQEWFTKLKISATGIKKLLANEVKDRESLMYMRENDVNAIKLGAADRGKLAFAILEFRVKSPEEGTVTVEHTESPNPTVQVQPPRDPPATGVNEGASGSGATEHSTPGIPHPGPQASGDAVPLQAQASQHKSFTLEEVAGFLAGESLPSALNDVLNCRQPNIASREPAQSDVSRQIYDANAAAILNPAINTAHAYSHPCGVQPYAQAGIQPLYPTQLPSLPGYSPPQQAQVPSRLSIAQGANQSAYHASVLRDYANINALNPRTQGENQLYLPVNFISHIRGSGSHDDEELCKTESGSKIYLANSPRKIQPDKLNQGLFLGANARILARMIPNLTPEIAVYLDYLRIVGDLLVNYTSQSVYLLDHCHRYEVVEGVQGRPFNFIDPSLSLNILKKKDVPNNAYSNASKSNGAGKQNGNFDSKAKTPICWQWNQPDGCKYPGCKYLHKCNVENCGAGHPAWKHVFRNQQNQQTSAQSPSTGRST